MSDCSVGDEIFVYLVKCGMDRVYAAVETVSREFPDLTIDAYPEFNDKQLKSTHWSELSELSVRVMVTGVLGGDYWLRLDLESSQFRMEGQIREEAQKARTEWKLFVGKQVAGEPKPEEF